jgi:hypothetical protein
LVAVLWLTILQATAFYDPTIQRWPNRDPLGETGFDVVLNEMPLSTSPLDFLDDVVGDILYSFSSANPINRVDLDGRKDVLFELCNRQIENPLNDKIIGLANGRGHDFYRWPDGDGGHGSVGYRNPNGKDGSMPEDDCPEDARTCRRCFRNGSPLQYGSGKGKRSHKATDEEVQDCLKNRPIKGDYHGLLNNSNDWAKGAGKDCGLSCEPTLYLVKPRRR